MRIYPAIHYTMGGLWVDYNLMSTIPGLFVLGEANFSDHGANRLGASALMQGLADGYFVIPYTIGDYLAARQARARSAPTTPAFTRRRGAASPRASQKLLSIKGKRTRRLVPPRARQDHVGVLRHGAQRGGPASTALEKIPALREEFWQNVQRARATARSSTSRWRRPGGGRLPGARRADVPATRSSATSPAAATSARSTRRPTARPCATTSTSATSRPGSTRATARRPTRHEEPLDVRVRPPDASGATSEHEAHAARLAPEGRARPRAGSSPTRRRTSAPTCRSSRCSTSSTSG